MTLQDLVCFDGDEYFLTARIILVRGIGPVYHHGFSLNYAVIDGVEYTFGPSPLTHGFELICANAMAKRGRFLLLHKRL